MISPEGQTRMTWSGLSDLSIVCRGLGEEDFGGIGKSLRTEGIMMSMDVCVRERGCDRLLAVE